MAAACGPVDEELIRTAIDKSNLNALRLALFQVTEDPELANMSTSRYSIRGGAMFAHVVADGDIPALKEKAFAYLSKHKPDDDVSPPPSKDETRKLMDMFGDTPVSNEEFDFNYEELAVDEFPREAQWTEKRPSAEKINAFKIVCIGGGISGVAAAVQFKRLGLNFTVLERQSDIGGTWLLNSYPDARVDVGSYLYQFKFVKNYPWSEYFAAAGETLRYLHEVVKRYRVEGHFHFNREVLSATWQEDSSEWELTIEHADGHTEVMRCNAIVNGSGLYSTPRLPKIKGVDNFKRPMFHSARWDHSVDYRNKRVALLGTGSTGTQLAPAVAAEAKSLTVFQRTANWITGIEGYGKPIDTHVRWLFDNMPYYWNWFCYSNHLTFTQVQYSQSYDREWQAKGGQISESNDKMRGLLIDFIKSKMQDRPDLVEKLMPHYSPMVRRLIVDNGFYDMLLRDHVELVTDGIESITETGIKTVDGQEREFDLIVLSTGWSVQEWFAPCKYVGRNGATLGVLWKKDGARSYLGLTLPGFPNFFSFYGPNHQPRSGGF
ncbi:hypothetical protein PMIN04_012136 [Paraphaeosphaeria minitans]|uniref:Flavin-binding monooxygenase (Steroid monooxygenase) n=1 Tax=Paraphaeosphaeria minitans TaxID=565426 RepID=A0A9P6KKV7_9PLEO|nr:flavin-binding monooxygenase (steroid monooxygenase) [Paraphaeosphaeria minitans]